MTKFVEVNWLSWKGFYDNEVESEGSSPGSVFRRCDLLGEQKSVGLNSFHWLTRMAMPGKVVGVLANVIFNNHVAGDHKIRFVKATGGQNNPVFTNIAEGIIPPMQTGLFATDPDTAEFNREFNTLDALGVEFVKDSGSSSTGIRIDSWMIGIEIETPVMQP